MKKSNSFIREVNIYRKMKKEFPNCCLVYNLYLNVYTVSLFSVDYLNTHLKFYELITNKNI